MINWSIFQKPHSGSSLKKDGPTSYIIQTESQELSFAEQLLCISLVLGLLTHFI